MKRPEVEPHATFTSLPETILHRIFGLLSARDLAAVSVQDKYLRYVAADSALWQDHAMSRWPGADADEAYDGDWHRLYMARAPLPHALPLAADHIRTVTAAQRRQLEQQQQRGGAGAAGVAALAAAQAGAGEGGCQTAAALPHMAFEEVMRQTFSAGVACGKDRALRKTPEWRGMKQDLTWWATQRPEVVVAFIRSTHESLAGGHGMWAAPRSWTDTPWRRSAVAFLLDMGLLTGAHVSVVNRIAAEAQALDRAIRSVQQQAGPSSAMVPAGVPTGHWWFN